MATTVDRIRFSYEADVGKFIANTNKAKGSLQSFTRDGDKSVKNLNNSITNLTPSVKGLIAAFSVGAIVGFTRKLANQADQLDKLAKRLGTTTEALSELRFVGTQSGVSFQQLTLGLQRMNRRISEAAKGTGEAKKALQELNISATDLNKLGLDQQFEIIADALSKLENTSDRTRLAMKFFDSEGVALTQTMGNGAEGIRKMRKEARDLGLSLEQKDIDAIVKAKDEIAKMANVIETLGIKALGGLAEKFNSLTESIKPFLETTKNALDQLGQMGGLAGTGALGGMLFDTPADAAKTEGEAGQGVIARSVGPAQLVLGGADVDNPELEKLKKQKEEQFLFLQKEWERRLDLDRQKEAERQRIVDASQSNLYRSQMRYIQTVKALDKASATQKIGVFVNMFDQIVNAAGQQNETMFKIQKAASIANAIVSTYQAANKALASGAPPWNFAAAAAVTAAGLANVATISSTSFSGGGGGTPSAPAIPSSPAAPAVPAPSAGGGGGGGAAPANNLNITVSGISPDEMFSGEAVTNLIGAINSQIQDGARIQSIGIS